MAVETFSYTNAASATKLLTFSISAPLLADYSKSIIPNQITGVTLGGIRLTKNLGSARTQWRYTAIVDFSSALTDLADVEEFIGSTYINFAENAFEWKEWPGYVATARTVYMINQFSHTMLGQDRVRIAFLLEEQNT